MNKVLYIFVIIASSVGACSSANARDGCFVEAGQATLKLKSLDTGLEDRVLALPYIEGTVKKGLSSKVPALGVGCRHKSLEIGYTIISGITLGSAADLHVSIWDHESRPLLLMREARADVSSWRVAWYWIRLGAAEPYVAAYQLRADGYARASIQLGRYSLSAEERRMVTVYTAGIGALYSLGPVALRTEVLYLGKRASHLQLSARAYF